MKKGEERTVMKLEIDAEFASLIPPLSAEEFMQLEANIVADGCRDPLIAWGNILIDGHNRLRICEKHGIRYQVVERSFVDRDEAIQYIILNQFGRRNLSVADRCLLALKLEPVFRAQAKKNQKQSPGRGKKGSPHVANLFPNIDIRRKLAKIAGVGHTTIARVKLIATEGTPEHIERIRQGGKGNSIRAVFFEVRGKRPSAQEDTAPAASPEPDTPANAMEPPREIALPDMAKSPRDDAASAFDTPSDEPEPCEDELEQIKRYVAELKNPDLNRSYTTEMFVVEYEAFAGRFIRSLGIFDGAPYSDIYPLLSGSDKETLYTLNDAMGRAIQQQNILIKG